MKGSKHTTEADTQQSTQHASYTQAALTARVTSVIALLYTAAQLVTLQLLHKIWSLYATPNLMSTHTGCCLMTGLHGANSVCQLHCKMGMLLVYSLCSYVVLVFLCFAVLFVLLYRVRRSTTRSPAGHITKCKLMSQQESGTSVLNRKQQQQDGDRQKDNSTSVWDVCSALCCSDVLRSHILNIAFSLQYTVCIISIVIVRNSQHSNYAFRAV